jgi:protein TonB
MFDTISVSEGPHNPWAVAASLAGQVLMIGMAILIPLVTTEALPRGRLISYLLSEPPPPPARHPAAPAKPVKMIPLQMTQIALRAPSRIPERVALIQDPASLPQPVSDSIGVPYSVGDPAGSGNRVIENLVRAVAAPPPPLPAAKEPAKPAFRRIVVGGQVQAAKLIFGPLPVYPPLAKQARISGTVLLEAIIARDGSIMDLHALGGHPMLIPAAIAAVKQWVFRPTILNGDPVEVATEITVTFSLRQ